MHFQGVKPGKKGQSLNKLAVEEVKTLKNWKNPDICNGKNRIFILMSNLLFFPVFRSVLSRGNFCSVPSRSIRNGSEQTRNVPSRNSSQSAASVQPKQGWIFSFFSILTIKYFRTINWPYVQFAAPLSSAYSFFFFFLISSKREHGSFSPGTM